TSITNSKTTVTRTVMKNGVKVSETVSETSSTSITTTNIMNQTLDQTWQRVEQTMTNLSSMIEQGRINPLKANGCLAPIITAIEDGQKPSAWILLAVEELQNQFAHYADTTDWLKW